MKKKLTIVTLFASITAFAIMVPTFANEKNNGVFSNLNSNLKQVQSVSEKKLIQVNDKVLSNHDLLKYKAFKVSENELKNEKHDFSDAELLKEMVIEELMLQQSKDENAFVTIEDATEHAKKMREFLKLQPKEAQDFQQKVISSTGHDEEYYWNIIAPSLYQDTLSKQNLFNKLVDKGALPKTSDYNEFGQAVKDYRESLYKKGLETKVKVFDNSINLK